MFSIEDLERALNATNQQRAALKAQGYSDGAINHILTHGTSSIVATSPVVAYVGSEPVYNFDVTDRYGSSLPTSATREERINAEGRKWSAANAALKTHMEENLQVGPSKQQQAHYLEIVCIKAQSLAYYPNIPALNLYKDSLPELEAKNIVQYEIDYLGWYGAVRNAIAGLNLPQLQIYINQRDWDKVSQQIIQDRINDVLGHPRRNFLEEELIAKQNYQVPIETIQSAMQKAIHAVGETVEQQKANDLLYATIEQANRQIRPSDKEEHGLTALEIPPQIIGNPEAIHRYLSQIEPLTRSLYLRWEATWYKPDKPLGGFIGKVGREFNKGLRNMGPIGKIVKPLIHLAAVASGNPYIVIGTSVTMGTLDKGAEGGVRGLMFGIMGAAGQQLAIAQQAGIPLVGESIPTGTLVSNPEALQIIQDLRALTTEQLSMAPSRIAVVGVQAINLTEEAIRTSLYMAPMAYSYATELTASTGDPVHDALIRRRRREFYINLAGMGAGTFVSTSSIPLFEGQNTFVVALGTGAIFGAVSSGISRGRPLRGALGGALFAGVGNIIDGRLSQLEFLQEAHRLREALGVAASSALHIVVRHGRGRDILIGVGSDLLGYAIVPPGIGVINEETLRMFVTGAIATLTSNTELGESMMAAWLGSNVQRIARQYGNNVTRNYQERRQPRRITNDEAERRASSKPKVEDDTWRSNSLKVATQKASEVLASKNIQVPEKRVRRAFEREPTLQGSQKQVQQNLIALGKADGPARDNISAFKRGLEKVFLAVLNTLVGEAHASEVSAFVVTRNYQKQEKQDSNWWSTAFRAFRGERTPEILTWQQHNRVKAPRRAAFFDGAHEGSEIFNKPLRKYKTEVRSDIRNAIEGIDESLRSGHLNETQVVLHNIKKTGCKVSGVVVDTVLPESMTDVGETLLLIMGGVSILTKTINTTAKAADKMLFLYRNHKKAEKLMKNGPTDRIQHEAIKTQYRQSMENPSPSIKDRELFKRINNLYRPAAKLGNKCSSDAARYELHTLKEVEGKSHIQKCQDTVRFLEKWLSNNQTAAPGDRSIAENVLFELKDSLGDRQWYSQTKPPKY